jgi:hypothetical protein
MNASLLRLLRRRPWERVSIALIALGALMLMQPFSLALFSYSFVVLLAGVIGYSIAGKLPADAAPLAAGPSAAGREGT